MVGLCAEVIEVSILALGVYLYARHPGLLQRGVAAATEGQKRERLMLLLACHAGRGP